MTSFSLEVAVFCLLFGLLQEINVRQISLIASRLSVKNILGHYFLFVKASEFRTRQRVYTYRTKTSKTNDANNYLHLVNVLSVWKPSDKQYIE